MVRQIARISMFAVSILCAGNVQATKLSTVAYGTVSAVSKQEKDNSGDIKGGAIIGGIIGLATSGGRSTGSTVLRTGVGAAAGGAVGAAAGGGSEMAYTVDLVEGGTVRVVMDSGSFREGDCVSVERGNTNNMRRVSSTFCDHHDQVPEEHKAEHQKEANECAQAKEELLAAKDEEAINVAHMKMNILCQD